MADVLAIVLNYRAAEMSTRCARSALASAGVELEVLVVDNASPDGSGALLAETFGSDRVLLRAENSGFAGGMNAGLAWWRAHSSSPFVLILTQDVVLREDTVAELVSAMKRFPRAGVTAPVLHYREDHAGGLSAGGYVKPARAHAGHHRTVAAHEPYAVDWADGGCLLVRRQVVEALSGFDERYFMYYEENDFCERVRQAGWEVRIAPDAVARHETTPSPGPHYFYYINRNAFTFWRENYRVGFARVALKQAGSTLRMGLGAVRSLVVPRLRAERAVRFRLFAYQASGSVLGALDYSRGRLGRQRF